MLCEVGTPRALCWPWGCCAWGRECGCCVTFPHSQTLSKTQLGFVTAVLLEVGAEEALETQQHLRGGRPHAPQAFRQHIPLQIPPLEFVRSLALLPRGNHQRVFVYSSTLGALHTIPVGTHLCAAVGLGAGAAHSQIRSAHGVPRGADAPLPPPPSKYRNRGAALIPFRALLVGEQRRARDRPASSSGSFSFPSTSIYFSLQYFSGCCSKAPGCPSRPAALLHPLLQRDSALKAALFAQC